jgi:hypothetical protein
MFLIPHPPAAKRHSGESRNLEIKTGCRIRSGMTSDTPLFAAGRFIYSCLLILIMLDNYCFLTVDGKNDMPFRSNMASQLF